ncbi:MAG: hypothetical protein AAF431_12555 [Pseudomonadota bacterium]
MMIRNYQEQLGRFVPGAVLATIIGGLYYYPFAYLWGYIAKYNPLIEIFLDLARNGMPLAFRVVVYIQDFLINLVLMLPLAMIIIRLQPRGSWLHILLALVACELVSLQPVWSKLIEHIEDLGVLTYLFYVVLVSAPALVNFKLLKNRLGTAQ